jgi:hypothetical protein
MQAELDWNTVGVDRKKLAVPASKAQRHAMHSIWSPSLVRKLSSAQAQIAIHKLLELRKLLAVYE